MRKFIKTEEESKKALITDLNEKDKKFISRKITRIEEEIDDAKSDLNKRLQDTEVIDNSVVEVTYAKIKNLEEKLNLYKNFNEEHILEKEEDKLLVESDIED